jgi:hypothetical protein
MVWERIHTKNAKESNWKKSILHEKYAVLTKALSSTLIMARGMLCDKAQNKLRITKESVFSFFLLNAQWTNMPFRVTYNITQLHHKLLSESHEKLRISL